MTGPVDITADMTMSVVFDDVVPEEPTPEESPVEPLPDPDTEPTPEEPQP